MCLGSSGYRPRESRAQSKSRAQPRRSELLGTKRDVTALHGSGASPALSAEGGGRTLALPERRVIRHAEPTQKKKRSLQVIALGAALLDKER